MSHYNEYLVSLAPESIAPIQLMAVNIDGTMTVNETRTYVCKVWANDAERDAERAALAVLANNAERRALAILAELTKA